MHRLQELVRLHRDDARRSVENKIGVREIARLAQMSPNTERAYRLSFEAAGLLYGEGELPSLEALKAAVGPRTRQQEKSSVEQWRDVIGAKLDDGAKPKAIYDFLNATEPTFTGSYWAVKRLCMRLRRERGPSADEVTFHLVTRPGKEAQVDFGSVGMLLDDDGVARKAYVFVMTLAHSRHAFYDVVFDQSSETWQRLHVDAFAFFGGVPEVIVPDNLKSAVIKAAFTSSQTAELNQSYREIARHYGFRVDPTPPYQPQKKGKVESDVGYVKNSFFKTWAPKTMRQAKEQLALWAKEIAQVRIHGTTKKRPIDAFVDKERAVLQPLPTVAYDTVVFRKAKVQRDAHVHVGGQLFSVPFKHIGKQAWVELRKGSVVIRVDDERVATHARGNQRKHTIDEHLPKERRDLIDRDPEVWMERARRIGPHAEMLVHDVILGDDVLRRLSAGQAIVKVLESVDKDRADAACWRAICYGVDDAKTLKGILDKGLEYAPVDDEAYGHLDAPVFSRQPH